ncbi:MAG: hypothetical protein MJ170_03715 [Alphaproteobacteria bacterium]|nr:hypothetical protein [Alphaproteobacteria bacterium]
MHKHIFTLGLISASLCTMTAMASGLPSFDCTDVWMDQNKKTPAKMVCADCCYNMTENDKKKLKCLSLDATLQYRNCWLPPAETYFDDLGREFKHSCSMLGENVNVNGEGEMFCASTILFERAKNGKCEETGYKVNWISSTTDFLNPNVGIDNLEDHIGYVGYHHDVNPNAVKNLPLFGEGPITPYGNEGRWVLDFTKDGTVKAKMYGTSACEAGDPLEKVSEPAETIEHDDAGLGIRCWCKVTKVGNTSADNKLDKPWTYITSFTNPDDCGTGCAKLCATSYADTGIRGNTMRKALFKAWWEKENK